MRVQVVRVLVGLFSVTLLGLPAPASAEHGNADEASPNMFHLAQRPRGGVNSDLAFWQGGRVNGRSQDLAAAGNYNGFRLINIADPENPVVVSEITCRGPQGDVSFYKAKNRLLVIVSVDTPQTVAGPPPGEKDCVSRDSTSINPTSFEGLRIWDVTNPTAPKFVTAVPTDCGSHTHTTIPDQDEQRAIVYVSSYPLAPTGIDPIDAPLEGGNNTSCGEPNPVNGRPHGKISIVEIPDAAPETAHVLKEQPLHADTVPSAGEARSVVGSVGCHDITVITEANQAPEADPKPRYEIAAAACLSEGQLWDIEDPANPRTLDPEGHTHVHNESIEIWHSAAFTWDAEVTLFGDEHGGGSAPGCGGSEDPTGNIWFYKTVEPGTPEAPLLGRYHIPRQQLIPPQECTLHNFNVVPINDNKAYIGVSSAYRAGTTVFDFTDARTAPEHEGLAVTAPLVGREVGFYDATVGGEADTWSTYWFNDYIYSNGGLGGRGAGNRGFDVFEILLGPGEKVPTGTTEPEPDAKQFRARKFHHLNPQTQEVFTVQGG